MNPVSLYIFFPPNSLAEAGLAGRDEVEDPLDDALSEAGLGEVVGAGGGARGSHIDVDVINESFFEQALTIIRRVLDDVGAPRQTLIKRFEPIETIYPLEETSED